MHSVFHFYCSSALHAAIPAVVNYKLILHGCVGVGCINGTSALKKQQEEEEEEAEKKRSNIAEFLLSAGFSFSGS